MIFDVDGVLVDSPHETAWGETLLRLMEGEWAPLAAGHPIAYTTEVYQTHVAGKVREEGAAALLRHFGIADPDGSRVQRLCELKQEMIRDLIEQGRFEAFPDALRFLAAVRAAGFRVAAASSSKNANDMLARVRPAGGEGPALIDVFDANVCGRDFKPGKPHPGIFLAAAKELGVQPETCVVIEDAPSGVAAAKAGGMACVGIARLGDEEALQSAGADRVVTSLDDLDPLSLP